jgi:hypothetical protein
MLEQRDHGVPPSFERRDRAPSCAHAHHNLAARARRRAARRLLVALALGIALALPPAGVGAGPLVIGVVGDYGITSDPARDVARLVDGWHPDLVITTGDNNYPQGAAETIDDNVGRYWSKYIAPYRGRYGAGSAVNRFFPALGNHDWDNGSVVPYLEYFALPGNERYYDVRRDPVHVFVVDSDKREPDGVDETSRQAEWLRDALTRSTACWKIVVFHHPAYTSGWRGPNRWMRWPFARWGADAVLSGHDHFYERLEPGDIPYFVNGAGGNRLYAFAPPVAESRVRFNDDYGAMRITIEGGSATFDFVDREGEVQDHHVVRKICAISGD